MIPYRSFVEFGMERDPNRQIRLAARAFMDATVFAGLAVSYADHSDEDRGFLFSRGYDEKALTHLGGDFIKNDPLYREAVAESRVLTWRSNGFSSGAAAEIWLKPVGYRNGFSIAVHHREYGEIGSVHANSYQAEFGEDQLDAASAFADYLSPLFGILRAQEQTQLTARELDVVRQIAEGWSNPEIATRLHISRSTVSTHVENILRKLGARSRVGIAVEATRLRLV